MNKRDVILVWWDLQGKEHPLVCSFSISGLSQSLQKPGGGGGRGQKRGQFPPKKV